MRLICPNCDAQYEVDARVIPDTGRDVQCSNCGHTWFQQPEGVADALEDEQPQDLDDAFDHAADFETDFEDSDEDDTQTSVADMMAQATQFEEDQTEDIAEEDEDLSLDTDVFADVESDESDDHLEDENEDFSDAPQEGPSSRAAPGLSASVKEILRSEAEFDRSQRERDQGPIESQPDLGLPAPAERRGSDQSLRDRMARLRGLDPADSGGQRPDGTAAGKRRDLLPDIEEIKSTLNAASERDGDGSVPSEEMQRDRSRRSAARSVFFVLILAVAIAIGLYVLAPTLAGMVPALGPTLETYVASFNDVRNSIDNLMSTASARLNDLLGQLNS